MKKHIFTLIIMMFVSSLLAQNSDLVFRSKIIADIRITIDQTVLNWVYANTESDSLHVVSISFQNENLDISFDSVGFRLRGNTSRNAAKKSFKLDFNEFIKGQDIAGIEKFNLKAEQNDPSLIRSTMAFELMEKVGLQASRVAYAKVYINNEYMGLYEIIEHIDENFASYHFGNNNGNLWKCLWPADLNYRGSDPQNYYPFNGPDRPYELKTNVEAYDYSELAHLIDVINNTPSAQLKDSLESVLYITDFIKYLAVNIMTGSWDDYRYLRNNYYLYRDPTIGKFRFIPYDYDNTFGIDWVGGSEWGNPNWARINMYSYAAIDDAGRPLSDIIFNDAEYRNLFTHFVEFYTNQVFREDQWRDYADSIKALIRPDVVLDTYYPRDHGFTMSDFDNSYDTDYRNGHVERGLYEFMRKRRESTNDNINWVSAPPAIYFTKFDRVGTDLNASVSAFSNDGITSVSLSIYNTEHSLISTESFTFNRISVSPKVEDFDRWTLNRSMNPGEIYYRITATDPNGVQSTWPRSGYGEFEQGSSSDLPLYINEFMASNNSAFADPAGEYDDWVEIYNASNLPADLSGLFLTDNPDNLDKWDFPEGTYIDAGGFLIVWCDEDGDKPQDGLHANFKLSAGGEFIALVDVDSLSVIDYLTFGPQTTDISFARSTDGGSGWAFTSTPTPGSSNIVTAIFDNMIPMTTALYPNYPNPFNPRTLISFHLSASSDVDLSIYDVRGRKIQTLFNGSQNAGTYKLDWNAGEHASGVYLAVLSIDNIVFETQKMLYIK